MALQANQFTSRADLEPTENRRATKRTLAAAAASLQAALTDYRARGREVAGLREQLEKKNALRGELLRSGKSGRAVRIAKLGAEIESLPVRIGHAENDESSAASEVKTSAAAAVAQLSAFTESNYSALLGLLGGRRSDGAITEILELLRRATE